MGIKEFFNVDKPAPEKIHIDIMDKDVNDRRDLYDTILRAVTAAFHRLFTTKELYKISVDIRLEKRMTKSPVSEKENTDEKEEVAVKDVKNGIDISSKQNSGSYPDNTSNKYASAYSKKNDKET